MPVTMFTLQMLMEEPVVFQSYSGFASCGVFYNLVKSVMRRSIVWKRSSYFQFSYYEMLRLQRVVI